MGKKNGGNFPVANLKKLIHCLQELQNERFALSEFFSETKQFPVQRRSERRILCNSHLKIGIKICDIQEASQLLRVSLPFPWFSISSKSFY